MVACPPHRYILEPNKSEARGVCYRCGHYRTFDGGVNSGDAFNRAKLSSRIGAAKRQEQRQALKDAERMAR